MNAALLVIFGHFFYTSAIMTNGPMLVFVESDAISFDHVFHYGQDGEALVWLSFWSLKCLWFKFLVTWCFARAWALLDGVAAPENMNRCLYNNYTVRGFWRAWHRSFNRWLVRYIFVPLGGSRGVSLLRQFASNAVVFTFVALWHEPSVLFDDVKKLHVLAWGWLMVLFLLPELFAERLAKRPRVAACLARRPIVQRHLQALGGSVCIQLLIAANLVGYSYGRKGAQYVLKACNSWSMTLFLLAHAAWLFSLTQLMLLIRQREARSLRDAKLIRKSF